jgi:4,5-dihydroxyphthalate decarboxylase
LAGYDFPRIAALASGKAKIAGGEVQFTPGKVGDMNTEAFHGSQTYDISEIGLHPFILAYANADFRDYTLGLKIYGVNLSLHQDFPRHH